MFVIYGNDNFLISKQIEKILKKVDLEQDAYIFKYSILEKPINEIVNEMTTIPLFSTKKIFIINDCNFLTAQRNYNLSENDSKLLSNYLNHKSDFVILILVVNSDSLDNRKKIVQLLQNNASIFPTLSLSETHLQKFIYKYVEKSKSTISQKAVDSFLANVPNNLNIIINELDKLIQYDNNIKEENISIVTSKYFENNIFNLTNNLLSTNKKDLLTIYYNLESSNFEPLALIGLIASQLRIIRDVQILKAQNYNEKDISQKLGINPYRIKKIVSPELDVNYENINKLLVKLYNLDYNIKAGRINKKLGLELFLISM